VADVIYLDNNATTRPLDEVVEAMRPLLGELYANPSSVHQFGQAARHRVECAREQVAALLGASEKEIIFTSGGTESINLAIRGTLASDPARRSVVTSAVEHSATRRLCDQLGREGYTVHEVGVDDQGRLDLDELADRMDEGTALVSVMWANNETGVLFDAERIADLTSDRGVPLHLDAVQAVGKIPIDVSALPVQLLSISGHKFHGPKGVGALFVRRKTRLRPQILGGRQERDLRGGTENAPGIVGLGVAAEAAMRRPAESRQRVAALRDRLEQGICDAVPTARVNGAGAPRVGNTTNIGFESLEAQAILMLLSEAGICVSSGAACSSGSLEPSHVLQAMNVEPRYGHGSIRFSLSQFTTEAEITRVVETLPALLGRLTTLSVR